MKKLFLIFALVGLCLFDANAQKKIPETITFVQNASRRTEIILPKVNGLNVYKADLHTHSIYSDGTLTPLELVKTAKEEGLSAVALTDHNSVKGLSEFMALGKEFNIETVAGTEITCEYNGKEIHQKTYKSHYY